MIGSCRLTDSIILLDGQLSVEADRITSTGINFCPPPTSLFVGREEQVQRAAAYLLSDRAHQQIFVIYGLGGAGKTQMALRIVESTREYWSDIVFADATSVATIEATLKDFATRKNIGGSHNDTIRWLASTTDRWLLIIDNADDPGVNILSYLPKSLSGRILITTRNQELLELATGPDSNCNASSMKPDEALQLLLKASRQENEEMGEDEVQAAKKLLEVVCFCSTYRGCIKNFHSTLVTCHLR